MGGGNRLLDSHNFARFTPKFFFILGIIFNLCLLGFFKYTDFLLENFNAFSQIAHLDFNIPLPHILLPLALSFVTFQQIAFLFDCYKHATGQSNENLHIDFIDYALFISFFPQLIAGPIVHHREMMPQFAKMGANSACSDFLGSASAHSLQRTASASHSFASHNPKNSSTILEFADSKDSNESSLRDSQRESWQSAGFVSEAKQPSKHSPSQTSPASGGVSFDSLSLALGRCSGWVDSTQKSTINYEFLAKGIFIFSIGLFKKVFIADSFAKWANAGFSVVEKGGYLNIAESWATSLSYTFQLYFDFSGYCDMAIGLGLMFGIVLPLNFNSPYKSLNIAEFWRRWHITLGRFLKECLYIPLGGNRGNGNSSLTRPSRELEKFSFDRQPALSQSNFSAQPTNLTQDTRIANDLRESNNPSLRDSQRESWQSAGFVSEAKQPSKNSPSLAEGARGWVNITTKILTLRNLFIVAFLSGIWHGAGWGFVIWGILHGVAMVIHRIYSWWIGTNSPSLARGDSTKDSPSLTEGDTGGGYDSALNIKNAKFANSDFTLPLTPSAREGEQVGKSCFLAFTQSKIYKILAWLITFNFINIAWIFFRAENLSGAVNLLKGMFGIVWVDLPQKAYKANQLLKSIDGTDRTFAYIIIAIIVCLVYRNSFEILKRFDRFTLLKSAFATILIIASLSTMLFANRKIEFLYFNF